PGETWLLQPQPMPLVPGEGRPLSWAPSADTVAGNGGTLSWAPSAVAVAGDTLDPETHRLWSPGIKLGVQPGSLFHTTECFGPVLWPMRAKDVDEAIALANAVPFGLTGGIHTLDDREIARWKDQIQVGNAYVNRPITGAVVRRQPFGGWKASNVGPGAKAGGPNYVLQLGPWRPGDPPTTQADPPPVGATGLAPCRDARGAAHTH